MAGVFVGVGLCSAVGTYLLTGKARAGAAHAAGAKKAGDSAADTLLGRFEFKRSGDNVAALAHVERSLVFLRFIAAVSCGSE